VLDIVDKWTYYIPQQSSVNVCNDDSWPELILRIYRVGAFWGRSINSGHVKQYQGKRHESNLPKSFYSKT